MLPAASLHPWTGTTHAGTNPMGLDQIAVIIGLGLVLGAGYWCTNFAVLQTAMAARNMDAARRVPLIAAIPKMLLPLVLILPGMLAVSLPTPQSKTLVTRNADGSIVHNIQVVAPEAAQGEGIVPARTNPVTREVMRDKNGQPLLDYERTTPNLIVEFFPTGLLGLGIAALLASLMAGMAGNLSACNTVFTYDIYQAHIRKDAGDEHGLAVARWTTAGAVLLAAIGAFALSGMYDALAAVILVLSFVQAPLLAILLLGMFWKRATGNGAFVGLVAGTAAAVLHHGLTVSAETQTGIQGGWLAILHRYPTVIAQCVWGAMIAFGVSVAAGVLVSLATKPKTEAELVGLVYSLTHSMAAPRQAWWKRPEGLAAFVLIAAVILNILIF